MGTYAVLYIPTKTGTEAISPGQPSNISYCFSPIFFFLLQQVSISEKYGSTLLCEMIADTLYRYMSCTWNI